MLKHSWLLVAAAVSFVAFAGPSVAQPADDRVTACREAHGGDARIARLELAIERMAGEAGRPVSSAQQGSTAAGPSPPAWSLPGFRASERAERGCIGRRSGDRRQVPLPAPLGARQA